MKQGVFISHIGDERRIAFELKSLLHLAFGKGLNVFVSSDYEDLKMGTDWQGDIISTLKTSKVALILCSRESVDRPWINYEAGIADGTDWNIPEVGRTHVIPIVIRNLAKGELRPPLARKQQCDIHDKGDMGALVKNLEEFLDMTAAPVDLDEFDQKISEAERSIRVVDRILDANDVQFEDHIKQILSGKKEMEFGILLEDLRARAADTWNIPIYSAHSDLADHIQKTKEKSFIPAMYRLTLLGLLLMKYSAPHDWFAKFVDCLQEIFEISNRIANADSFAVEQDVGFTKSLNDHKSHTVPALEALISLYTVAAFALVRGQSSLQYIQLLFPRIESKVTGARSSPSPTRRPFAFWPLTGRWGYPNLLRWQLTEERYGAGRIIDLIGGAEKLKVGVMSFQAIVEWNSYLAVSDHPAIEVQNLIKQRYPQVSFEYPAQFWDDDPNLVMPQFERLWNFAVSPANADKAGLAIDFDIATNISGRDQKLREALVLGFFRYVEKKSEDGLFAQSRMPYPIYWPFQIEKAFHNHGLI